MTEGSDPGTGRSLDGTGSDRSPAAQEAVGIAVRLWWVSVLRGCLALTLGVGALISGASQSVLVNYIALYWLLGGLLTTRWALAVRWKAGARIGLAAGLLATGTGLILLVRSALVDVVDPAALIGVVALTTMATGGLRLVGAFEVEEQTGHRWTMGGIILGSVEVLLGIILFIVRDAHASTVRITIGVWALVAGTLLFVQGIRMLRIRRASRMSTRI
jgi:uncharacterized membrane protein HdeD (DUF308 family)